MFFRLPSESTCFESNFCFYLFSDFILTALTSFLIGALVVFFPETDVVVHLRFVSHVFSWCKMPGFVLSQLHRFPLDLFNCRSDSWYITTIVHYFTTVLAQHQFQKINLFKSNFLQWLKFNTNHKPLRYSCYASIANYQFSSAWCLITKLV